MQLMVLKRIDPSINKFLFVSTFCSIFENDEATSQWHALDYEGSLYVVEKGNASDYSLHYELILLNRKKKDDFIEGINENTKF